MLTIELQTFIEPDGTVHLPAEYRRCFGRSARLIVLLPEAAPAEARETEASSAAASATEIDPYTLGEDLFDLGGPASPPGDPLKRQIWERLYEKYGAR